MSVPVPGTPPLHALTRPAAGEPEGALVLLHGRGADEHDLVPLLDALDPERRLLGVTPRAPLSPTPGFAGGARAGGAHWYRVVRVGFPDPHTFWPTWEALRTWFDALGIPPGRTVLGGFSQGAVMAAALALAAGRPRPAGLLMLSGFLPTVAGLELEPDPALPVAIGHGTLDPVIGVELGRAARDRLATAGLDVLWRESPMGHTIDPGFLADVREWLPV